MSCTVTSVRRPQLVVRHRLGHGVYVEIPDRQDRRRNALFVEVLRVAAAVSRDVSRREAGGGDGGVGKLNGGVVVGKAGGLEATPLGVVDATAEVRRCVLAGLAHGSHLPFQRVLIEAARLPDELALGRHDVGRLAARHHAHVGHRHVVNLAQRHVVHRARLHGNGVDAVARGNARVRGPAVKDRLEAKRAGLVRDEIAHGAAGIVDECHASLDVVGVEGIRAELPHVLAHREDQLDGP